LGVKLAFLLKCFDHCLSQKHEFETIGLLCEFLVEKDPPKVEELSTVEVGELLLPRLASLFEL
jgi:hypothetical protein